MKSIFVHIILIAPLGMVVLGGGCSAIRNVEKNAICKHQPIVSAPPIVVRTGGELQSQRTLTIEPGTSLTLRQAIIESGGLRESCGLVSRPSNLQPEILLNPVPVAVQAANKEAELPSPSTKPDAAEAGASDSALSDQTKLNALKAIFEDVPNMSQLLRVDPQRRPYTPPLGNSQLSFLQNTIQRMTIAAAFNAPAFDTNRLNPNETNVRKLLDMLVFAFEASANNNRSFAEGAIKEFNRQKEIVPTTPNLLPQIATSPVFATAPKPKSYLIGLESRIKTGETVYFHPQLVFQSAIGDIPLRDGDFVFAVLADQTSLGSSLEFEGEYAVPVIGVSAQNNAVKTSEYKLVAQVLKLQLDALATRKEALTNEHISVLRRGYSGTARPEVFYIPMRSESQDGEIDGNPSGAIRPGDEFSFTFASRSPIIYERMLAPLTEKLKAEGSELAEKAKRRSKLPAEGRFLTATSANWNYYTRPIIQGAKNIVR